jgi:hypothetical protein
MANGIRSAGIGRREEEATMFGRSWVPGNATIVALKEVKTFGYDANNKNKLQGFEYVADVQPEGSAPAFRVVMSNPFNETYWHTPRVGDVLPVKCDPGRQKAKFDTSKLKAQAEERKKDAEDEQAAAFDAAAGEPPGSPAP